MEKVRHFCDEIHVYDCNAERTGVVLELNGMKRHPRTCTSMRDLVRKYKLYGDGLFYLPAGRWPEEQKTVTLDNVKWLGMDQSMRMS